MSHVSMVVLGASAYSDPLDLGCVPIAMQSFVEVEALSFSDQLIIEHDRGSWFLHCGNYVAQQGGCIPCFLHKLGVFGFCIRSGKQYDFRQEIYGFLHKCMNRIVVPSCSHGGGCAFGSSAVCGRFPRTGNQTSSYVCSGSRSFSCWVSRRCLAYAVVTGSPCADKCSAGGYQQHNLFS